jgi:hypothetical protein
MSYTQKQVVKEKHSNTPSKITCGTYPKSIIPYWYEDAFSSFEEIVEYHRSPYTEPDKSWEKYHRFRLERYKDKVEKEQPHKHLYTTLIRR